MLPEVLLLIKCGIYPVHLPDGQRMQKLQKRFHILLPPLWHPPWWDRRWIIIFWGFMSWIFSVMTNFLVPASFPWELMDNLRLLPSAWFASNTGNFTAKSKIPRTSRLWQKLVFLTCRNLKGNQPSSSVLKAPIGGSEAGLLKMNSSIVALKKNWHELWPL